ncbi:ABC transporter permease [Sodalis sp. dw_96]|uniref:ABC transporter permease n=1 Tax=Sodalis sp. dw_96 TaxID=2719794 RepID=UPI001BD35BC4|nr:ABC transporter permease [Sodalis sp. dw_96]
MSTVEQNQAVTRLPALREQTTYPARRKSQPWGNQFIGLIVPAAGLVLWEALARTGVLPPNILPAPTVVAQTILDLGRSGDLWRHTAITLWRIITGFLLGAAVGTVLGGLTGYVAPARRLLDPFLQSLRNIPSMAWVPLFLLWLGIDESSKIGLISLGAFFPVYLNLSSGISQVDPKLIEVGKVYRLSGLQMIRRLILPAVLPEYIVGLRSGLGLAWMFVVAAEMMGASRGLGFLMIDGQMTGRASVILASVILFAILGKLSDFLLEMAGRRLLSYKAR